MQKKFEQTCHKREYLNDIYFHIYMKRYTTTIGNVGSVCDDIGYQELSNAAAKRVNW